MLKAEQGSVSGTLDGVQIVRHFGDPAAEYAASTIAAAVVDRSHRVRLGVVGRSPAAMIEGLITSIVPPPGDVLREGVLSARSAYGAMLTPKGKMITDLRVWSHGASEGAGLILDLPRAGGDGLKEHLSKFLPPRLATIEDRSEATGMITVLGPGGAEAIAKADLGLSSAEVAELEEGDMLLLLAHAGAEREEGEVAERGGDGIIAVMATDEVEVPAFDIVAARVVLAGILAGLRRAGVRPAGQGVWETLRIEAGRPAYGPDMSEDTIPIEAGIGDRAIDSSKGCYTGQEVIVRIRDRGRVNRHLRGALLGDAPHPASGTELFSDGDEAGRAVGWITSGAQSPRMGQTIALAYVRREVEPPADLRLGSPDGPRARIRKLSDSGWVLLEGDVQG